MNFLHNYMNLSESEKCTSPPGELKIDDKGRLWKLQEKKLLNHMNDSEIRFFSQINDHTLAYSAHFPITKPSHSIQTPETSNH